MFDDFDTQVQCEEFYGFVPTDDDYMEDGIDTRLDDTQDGVVLDEDDALLDMVASRGPVTTFSPAWMLAGNSFEKTGLNSATKFKYLPHMCAYFLWCPLSSKVRLSRIDF